MQETIYDGTGQKLGLVSQRRELRSLDGGRLLVRQNCQPESQLEGGPMAAFKGDFEFELKRDGAFRNYLGPDVVGFGAGYGDAFLQGQGTWPRFGYTFRSWSVSLGENLQVTGGTFFKGEDVAAVVVGIGVPEGLDTPQFQDAHLKDGSKLVGESVDFDHSRQEEGLRTSVTRRMVSDLEYWEYCQEQESHYRLELHGNGYIMTKNGDLVGAANAYGPILIWDICDHKGQSISGVESRQSIDGQQFSLRRQYQYGSLVSLHGIKWSEDNNIRSME